MISGQLVVFPIEIRNRPPADVRSKSHRSPQVHGFHATAIVDGEERVAIVHDDRPRGVRNGGAAAVEDETAALHER